MLPQHRLQFQRLVRTAARAACRRRRRYFHRRCAATDHVAQSLPAEPPHFQHTHAHTVCRRCRAQAEALCDRGFALQYGRAASWRRRRLRCAHLECIARTSGAAE